MKKFCRGLYIWIERFTRFRASVLACSASEQEMAVKDVHYIKERALLWHNSVPDTLRERGKPVTLDFPYACYIGRPCYQKNTLFLLDVIKKLKDTDCNLKFVLLGVGYHSPELETMRRKITELDLADKILLMPWISHADCQEYVRSSLFYITTSLYEGLPLSVIEAMANGKPIIASNVVGNKDCVKDGENGWLLPLDVKVFTDKIINLIADKCLQKEMGTKSRQIFLNEFFIKKQIGLLQKIYEDNS